MKSRSRRAVSPVIATVILVAVAITITIAVAYWVGGIAGMYTKFEKIEIQSAVCAKGTGSFGSGAYWNVTCTLKNSGSATATLTSLFINDFQVGAYEVTQPQDQKVTTDMGIVPLDTKPEQTIDTGLSATIHIYIDGDYPPPPKSFTPGTTINIKFHSAGGMDYVKLVELV